MKRHIIFCIIIASICGLLTWLIVGNANLNHVSTLWTIVASSVLPIVGIIGITYATIRQIKDGHYWD